MKVKEKKIKEDINKNETENINLEKNIYKNTIIEKLLLIFIVLSPVFDIASFLFRNYFDTKISISTFIRPIIPIIALVYIFFNAKKEKRKKYLIIALTYILYGIIHLLVSKNLFNKASDGTIKTEMQYIFNFTFLVIYLIIYVETFTTKNEKDFLRINIGKLSNAITIMCSIYLISIIFSIITHTSSYTYIETSTGYKGYIESGNSLSTILVLSLFIILPNINIEKFKKSNHNKKDIVIESLKIIVAIVNIIYLITTIGTRTGLLGAFLAIICFIIIEMAFSKNKKVLFMGGAFILIGLILVIAFGSNTIKRRAQMKESALTIIDEQTNQVGNMTGDMLKIKDKILNNTLEENFLTEAQRKSTIELYEYAKSHNIKGNDTRRQQLIYNIFLVKNQKNPLTILFGNGYKANFREMVLENEFASLILNFGIFGFILYVMPIVYILLKYIKKTVKNIINLKELEKNDSDVSEYKKTIKKSIMYELSVLLSLVLSFMSGYVLFATSSMLIIDVLLTLIIMEYTYSLLTLKNSNGTINLQAGGGKEKIKNVKEKSFK